MNKKNTASAQPIIEKGIPAPVGVTALLKKMEIGDSIFFARGLANASTYAKNVKIRLTSRKEGNGRRVWRIA